VACFTQSSSAVEAETEYRGSTMVVEAPSVEIDLSVLEDEGSSENKEDANEPLKFKNIVKDSSEDYSDESYSEDNSTNEDLEKIEKEINKLEAETASSHPREDRPLLKPRAPKLDFNQ